jgi:hypothetical protein
MLPSPNAKFLSQAQPFPPTFLLQLAKDGNLRLDAFTAAPKMFTDSKTTPFNARFELFFVDYDMIPL